MTDVHRDTVMIFDKPTTSSTKGEEYTLEHMDIKTGSVFVPCETIGLGYKDFEDEEDYNNRIIDVIESKLKEVGVT